MKYGPLDVVILATGQPRFEGQIVEALARLADAGTVRVLDAMLLVMNEEGDVTAVDIEDLPAEQRDLLGFVDTGTRGLFDSADSEVLTEGMVPGSAVVALAIENRWAVELINAMEEAGAELAMTWRVPAAVVEDAMAEVAVLT